MNLDRLLKEVRAAEPSVEEETAAVERVRGRLFPNAAASATIKGCADFQALMTAYLAGSLDGSRRMLLDVHVRECVACRRTLAELRTGARNVVEFAPRKAATRRFPTAPWAIAAAAVLTAGLSFVGYRQFFSGGSGGRATVESVEGDLYKVDAAALTSLAPGAQIGENDRIRTAKNSTAVVRLADGSKIELNQRAEISVSNSKGGAIIHLALGNIIVQAAKQRSGTLQVATADCNVSVKGTIFSVNAGMKGSRVAVVEGTVWVDHGPKHDVLHKGDETSTAPDMSAAPVREEFEWSRNSVQYLAVLGEFNTLKQQIAAIPGPGLRHESALMGYLPADVAAVAAIPNVGDTLGQASRIFHERLQQSGPLATWWSSVPPARRQNFEKTIAQIETAGSYLGNEIVIAGLGGAQPSPVILAELNKPGFEAYLRSQMPAAAFDGHMRFDNGLFVAAANPADLDRVNSTNDFAKAALYRQLSPLYRQGAGWLLGTDLARMNHGGPLPSDARFIVAESRTVGANTENHASVTFAHNRQGVASWLNAPGPMGTLDFVSPDAAFAASMLLKNPALIAQDMTSLMHVDASGSVTADLAGAFAGEVTIALDGPLLPAPSWKIAAEINNPDRLRSGIAKMVENYNAEPNERTGLLKLTQSEADGKVYYRLQAEKLPWEADWTFDGPYWIAAANRELVVRALQNRQVGFVLSKSDLFRAQLPHDAATNFSAVIFHNLGPTVGPIYKLLGGDAKDSKLPKLDMKPGAICFLASPDRIDAAAMGGIFGMNIESLLAMQGMGPLGVLRGMVPGMSSGMAPGMSMPK